MLRFSEKPSGQAIGPIEIEPSFDECVRRLGGDCVRDRLSEPPSFDNADYLFCDRQIVAELKCLTQDPRDAVEFQQRLGRLYQKWVAEGKMPPAKDPRMVINSRDLPRDCAIEFLGEFKRKLEGPIKKANRQLRETAAHFRLPNPKGVLLLANDGNLALHPSAAFNLLFHILRGQYSNINAIVYFTVNLRALVPGIPEDALLWFNALVPDRDPVEENFLLSLSSQWFETFRERIRQPVRVHRFSAVDPDHIEGIGYLPDGCLAER
jgi:hypothetical protein